MTILLFLDGVVVVTNVDVVVVFVVMVIGVVKGVLAAHAKAMKPLPSPPVLMAIANSLDL